MNNYILIIILLLLIIFNLNFKEGLNKDNFNIDDISSHDKNLFNEKIHKYDPSLKSNFLDQITKIRNELLKKINHANDNINKVRNKKVPSKYSNEKKNKTVSSALNSNS